jgi:PKD repeat protein
MKKIIFLVIIVILEIPGFSQGWVSISGIVSDLPGGLPIPGHAVTIQTDSTNGALYYNVVYTDSAGYYHDEVPIMNDSTGFLYVQIVDCNGTLYQGVFEYNPVNNIFSQDFQICREFTACQALFNYFSEPAGSPNSFQFTDASTGNYTSWFWNFGDGITSLEQNPYHIFLGPGTYETCLTIEGFNCSDTYCLTLTVSDTVFCQVYGQVLAGNLPMQQGIVNLFSMAPNWGGYQPFGESFPVDSNGIYYFTLVPAGQYLIQAVPFDSSSYLPTYFDDAIEWPWALPLFTAELDNPYNISLRETSTRAPGSGAITGQISGGGMERSLVDMVNMLLMDSNYLSLGFRSVSASGQFGFDKLGFGKYYLKADLPGFNSYAIPLELTAEQPHVEVSLGFIDNSILGVKEKDAVVAVLTVYPNPAVDRLNISLNVTEKAEVIISLFNLTRQIVYQRNETFNQGQNTISIPVGDLPPGIYTVIVILDDGRSFTNKVIISG